MRTLVSEENDDDERYQQLSHRLIGPPFHESCAPLKYRKASFVRCIKSSAPVVQRSAANVLHRVKLESDVPAMECDSLMPLETRHLSTRQAEQMAYYLSNFHLFTQQICSWTELLPLPRKSAIPSITRISKRSARGMTNWANFYLPHLATGAADDPLSLAMVVLVAYKMSARDVALQFYAKVLRLLRAFIKEHATLTCTSNEYARTWATTLLLAEFEAQQGNQRARAQHIEGATTICLLAEHRKARSLSSSGSPSTNSDSSEALRLSSNRSSPENTETTMPEQLTRHLQELTQRFRHSSTICLPIERDWPAFTHAIGSDHLMSAMLKQSAECYAHCMQIVELHFNQLNELEHVSQADLIVLQQSFSCQLVDAKAHLDRYDRLLQQHSDVAKISQSCAPAGTPFSPIIHFGNPHMIQAHLVTHVLKLLLSPLMPDVRNSSLRFISGVYIGLAGDPELHLDAAYPDIYIFAFWKHGLERDYFRSHISRRNPAFQKLIFQVWEVIDATEARLGHSLSSTDIIRLTLRLYKAAQSNASTEEERRYFQVEGLMARLWSVAIGSDPSVDFQDGPQTRKYRMRIQQLRQSFHVSDIQQGQNDTVFAFRESGPLPDQKPRYLV